MLLIIEIDRLLELGLGWGHHLGVIILHLIPVDHVFLIFLLHLLLQGSHSAHVIVIDIIDCSHLLWHLLGKLRYWSLQQLLGDEVLVDAVGSPLLAFDFPDFNLTLGLQFVDVIGRILYLVGFDAILVLIDNLLLEH